VKEKKNTTVRVR